MTQSKVNISIEQLDFINEKLLHLSPEEIIRWAYITFPRLYQTTAFGLTGLVTIDMISKMKNHSDNRDSSSDSEDGEFDEKHTHPIDLVFIDTLHHFPQTYELVEKVKEKYNPTLHIYKPEGVLNEVEFAAKYGDMLWEKDDKKYDYLVKVEPLQRSYRDLNVVAVLTGRRRSQGASRKELPVVEIEEASGTIKINPLCNWDFKQVKEYIDNNNVPYNDLLDLGYKSIGDWHSTVPVAEGEDERAGRWKGQAKTECGIHEASKFGQYLKQQS